MEQGPESQRSRGADQLAEKAAIGSQIALMLAFATAMVLNSKAHDLSLW